MSGSQGRHRAVSEADLLHDWNTAGAPPPHRVEVSDETLRDGIQSASARNPPAEVKCELLSRMDALGVGAASLGMPCTGERGFEDALALAKHVREKRLQLEPYCAGRTVVEDMVPIAEVAQRSGQPVVAHAFVGSSTIRQWTEGWDVAFLRRASKKAIAFARREGLEVAFVTEDTTRSSPEHLEALFRTAVDAGATRLVLCDTVGHATPEGARALVAWTRRLLDGWGLPEVRLEWHGHNDRGLALASALAALQAGAHRAHGCGLGLGERAGNTPLELLLLNIRLLGWGAGNLRALVPYARGVSEALGLPIPPQYPLVGADAFRTATGVHAAALLKARARGNTWLADRVYSAVPAGELGREQLIEVGPMSGRSNVRAWLASQGVPATEALCRALLRAARQSAAVLTDEQLRALCAQVGARPSKRRKGRKIGPVS